MRMISTLIWCLDAQKSWALKKSLCIDFKWQDRPTQRISGGIALAYWKRIAVLGWWWIFGSLKKQIQCILYTIILLKWAELSEHIQRGLISKGCQEERKITHTNVILECTDTVDSTGVWLWPWHVGLLDGVKNLSVRIPQWESRKRSCFKKDTVGQCHCEARWVFGDIHRQFNCSFQIPIEATVLHRFSSGNDCFKTAKKTLGQANVAVCNLHAVKVWFELRISKSDDIQMTSSRNPQSLPSTDDDQKEDVEAESFGCLSKMNIGKRHNFDAHLSKETFFPANQSASIDTYRVRRVLT